MIGRRSLLMTAAAFGGWRTLGTPGLALADAPTENRMILVILRGGLDGLAAVPPFGDAQYRQVRGSLSLPAPGDTDGVIDLDGFFALHPALSPIHELYRRDELLVIHAAASPYRERSHFDGQDVLENGGARVGIQRDGWLNRALGLIQTGGQRLGLAVGHGVPLVLRGDRPVASWAPSRLDDPSPHFLDKVAGLYGNDPALARALAEGRRAEMFAERTLGGNTAMGRGNTRSPQHFKLLAEAAARLIAAPDGPRIGVVEMGGWDTHAGQGSVGGRLAGNLARLGEGLRALADALGPAWRHTAVVVVTEFGRTVSINGSRGTDHGTAGAAFVLGGAVAGGRVISRWPGLTQGALYQGRDLAPTIDLRSLFKGVFAGHYGLSESELATTVFPGSSGIRPMREVLRG